MLADKLAVSRPSVTGVVDGLVARGLVRREHSDADRRRVSHDLTPDGHAVLAAADAELERKLTQIAEHRGADDEDPVAALARGVTRSMPIASPVTTYVTGCCDECRDRRPAWAHGRLDSFVPEPPASHYRAPRAAIDPDQDRSWLRRAWPVVLSHRWTLGTALVLSFVALVLQVQIPNILNHAVTYSLERKTTPLSHYVWLSSHSEWPRASPRTSRGCS